MHNKESKYTRFLRPIGSTLFSCCNCGKHLRREDLAVDCADCGAVFCEDCVKSGALDEHICEDDDEERNEEGGCSQPPSSQKEKENGQKN